LSKSAVAGAQSLLTFLMARTPGGPDIVKEVKPSALIGWRDIGFGTVSRGGAPIPVFDCPMDQAVSSDDPASMVARGAFGVATGDELTGVYIDTGENGVFTADEFATITALGQMEMVTPEEIADAVVREIIGANTGLDIVAALDGSIMGPTYRGGALRSVALRKLRALEAEHGKSIAFEMLGPPRLSKLLFGPDRGSARLPGEGTGVGGRSADRTGRRIAPAYPLHRPSDTSHRRQAVAARAGNQERGRLSRLGGSDRRQYGSVAGAPRADQGPDRRRAHRSRIVPP
jgi:hypothetical protein